MSRIINTKTLREKQFHSLKFEGNWQKWIGNPERNFTMMIYGPSGSGKSTFVLRLSDYLASHFGKVLYNSYEEGYSQTLKDRIISNDISSPGLYFADRMPYQEMCEKIRKGRFHFGVIDSMQYMNFSYSMYKSYVSSFRTKSLIIISQTNNKGTVKGGTDILHAVDIKIKIQAGHAHIQSRFASQNQSVSLFKNNNTLF